MARSNGGVWLLVLLVVVVWASTRDGVAMPTGDSGDASGGSVRGCVVDKPKPVAGFNKTQMRHAATIAQVGINKDMGERGVLVGLATAMQESGLANLPHLGARNDHDSVGLFQQRASWGSVKERRTPKIAARKFFNALKRVDRWRDMRVTEAAQAVQISAYPEAYQKHVPRAKKLTRALLRHC